MHSTRRTKEYPAVGSFEFEEWAKQTLDEINMLVEEYRTQRMAALTEFMDFLDREVGYVRCTKD